MQRSAHPSAPRQSRLHELVHVTAHDAPLPHVTLLLAPTVTSQLASVQDTFELCAVRTRHELPAAHSTLHDS